MNMPSRNRGLGPVSGLILAVVVFGPTAAASAHSRVTCGDVEAIFQARTTANQIQSAHGNTVSAVRQGFIRGRISPFFNSHAFCSGDWLVLLVSEGAATTHRESVAYRAQIGVTFTMDGQPVSTQQTALKRFLTVPPTGDFWGWSVGHFYAPDSLGDGDHTLTTTTTRNGVVLEVITVTVTVGSGSEFCG
jgi:hypothetical protein